VSYGKRRNLDKRLAELEQKKKLRGLSLNDTRILSGAMTKIFCALGELAWGALALALISIGNLAKPP